MYQCLFARQKSAFIFFSKSDTPLVFNKLHHLIVLRMCLNKKVSSSPYRKQNVTK